MSAADPDPVESAARLDRLPVFALEYEFDDPLDPAEVTIFDASASDRTTHWITVGAEVAIDLDSIA